MTDEVQMGTVGFSGAAAQAMDVEAGALGLGVPESAGAVGFRRDGGSWLDAARGKGARAGEQVRTSTCACGRAAS